MSIILIIFQWWPSILVTHAFDDIFQLEQQLESLSTSSQWSTSWLVVSETVVAGYYHDHDDNDDEEQWQPTNIDLPVTNWLQGRYDMRDADIDDNNNNTYSLWKREDQSHQNHDLFPATRRKPLVTYDNDLAQAILSFGYGTYMKTRDEHSSQSVFLVAKATDHIDYEMLFSPDMGEDISVRRDNNGTYWHNNNDDLIADNQYVINGQETDEIGTGERHIVSAIADESVHGHFWVSSPFLERYRYGDVAELVVFDRAIDDDEARDIECYLSDKYDIALTPEAQAACTNNQWWIGTWFISNKTWVVISGSVAINCNDPATFGRISYTQNTLDGNRGELFLPTSAQLWNGNTCTNVSVAQPVFHPRSSFSNIPWSSDPIAIVQVGDSSRFDIKDNQWNDVNAELYIPAPGVNDWTSVNIYSSEDGTNRSFHSTSSVFLRNGEPYVSFTTTHFTFFTVWVASGTFVINNDDLITNSQTVTLNTSITWITEMRFGNSPAQRDAAAFVPYSASTGRTLSAGNGTKTVYAEFRDALNNTWTVEDTIIMMVSPTQPSIAWLTIQYDASDLANVTLDVSSWVAIWNDDSGAGNDANQSDSAERPAFSGTILGWLPGIIFDGTNDYLPIENLFYQTNALSGFLACAVFQTDFVGWGYNGNWSLLDFDRSDYFNFYVRGDDGRVAMSYRGWATRDIDGTSAVNDGQPQIACVWYNNSIVNDTLISVWGTVEVNSNIESTSQTIGINSTRYGFLGEWSEATTFDGNRNSIWYDGAISEMLYFDQAVSDVDRQDIECYLSDKRNISLSFDCDAITASIDYSTTVPTTWFVIATVTGFSATGITITNNGWSVNKLFTENWSFVFEFEDSFGNTWSATATVTNIYTEWVESDVIVSSEVTNIQTNVFQTVYFERYYDQTPIVLATPRTTNNGDNYPIPVIRNVSRTGYEISICVDAGNTTCENTWIAEDVDIMIVDVDQVGTYSRIDAGVIATSTNGWLTNFAYNTSFSSSPYIFTTPQTANQWSNIAAIAWADTIGTTSASLVWCVHQSAGDTCQAGQPSEQIAYVAIDIANANLSWLDFGLESIPNSDRTPITFSPSYTDPWVMVTQNGESGWQDPQYARSRNVTAVWADIRYCEQDGANDCDGHNNEDVVRFSLERETISSPTATINYQPSTTTTGTVIATLTGFSKPWLTITNNGWSDQFVFSSNGGFTFEFEDQYGNTGSTTATVTRIVSVLTWSYVQEPIQDASIDGDFGYRRDYNYGASDFIFVGNGSFALLKFDLTSIPKWSTVNDATLRLTKERYNPNSFEVRGLINNTWIEWVTDQDTANPGEPTFNHQAHPSTDRFGWGPWLFQNNDFTADQFVDGTPTSTINDLPVDFTLNSSWLLQLEDRVNNSWSNRWFVLANGSDRLGWHSRESTTPAFRPQLSVNYTVDNIPPTATVSYDPSTTTLGSVVATLTWFSEEITITNNSGSATYVFTDNGSFVFEYEDIAWNTWATTATVTRIITSIPSVSLTSPLSWAVWVWRNQQRDIIFNKPMNTGSYGPLTNLVSVSPAVGWLVGTRTDSQTLVVTHDTLDYVTDYTVTVTDAIEDLDGMNPLFDYQFGFQTESNIELIYDSTYFEESINNDGTVQTLLTVMLSWDTFDANIVTGWYVSAFNLPAGLNAEFTLLNSTTLRIGMTGIASPHDNSADKNNGAIVFTDNAFATYNSFQVTNSARSDIEFNFFNPFTIDLYPIYDTSISATNPDTNYGVTDYMEVASDWSAWLLYFDFSLIPTGATINSAIFNIERIDGGWTTGTWFEVRALIGNPRIEWDKDGATATAGEPTYNDRAFPSTNWIWWGPWLTPWIDYENVTMLDGTWFTVNNANENKDFYFNTYGLSVLTERNNNPSSQSWLVILWLGDSMRIGTREQWQLAPRPLLQIQYTPDNIPPTGIVEYSTTGVTFGNVTATLTGLSETVTVLNNGGSFDYVFTENGSFTFEFQDIAWNTGETIATVTRIQSGSLEISSITWFTFSSIPQVDSQIVTLAEQLTGAFSVTDTIGQTGRYTTISITDLTGSTDTISNSSVFVRHTTAIELVTGDANPEITLNPSLSGYVSLSWTITYLQRSATPWPEQGTYTTNPFVRVDIPAYTKADTYQGVITYTLIE